MPEQTAHFSALRGRHSGRVYVSVMTGSPVLTGTLSATPTLPALTLSYTLTSGAHADVQPGMRVVITSPGGAPKGTLSVRYAGSSTSTSLPVREFADVNAAAGDTLTVYDDFALTDKLVSGDAAFAPDGAAYVDQTSDPAPVAVSGGWWAGWIGTDIPFTGSGSYAVDLDSSGALTHVWTAPGATFVSGTSTSADPVLRYAAAGRYRVTHTVTDASNGRSETQHLRVRVHDWGDAPYDCTLSSVEGDPRDGFRATFGLFENADLAAIPDGAPVIVWTDAEAYGSAAAGRSHLICAGYLRRDRSRGDADGDQIEFEVVSPLTRLAELPGFSKALVSVDAPTNWNEVRGLTVKRAIIQLLRDYTNALHLFDLVFDGFADAAYPAFYLQKSTPYEQVMELADARDARLTCDRMGRLEVARRLEFTPLSARVGVTTTLTLSADDVLDYEIRREHGRMLETFRARGFTVSDQQPAFARYPASPGTGSASPISERLIVDDAADLLTRCALRGAWENRVCVNVAGEQHHAPEVRLTLFGGYAHLFQFYREWVCIEGIGNLRGVDLAAFRWIPQRVRVDYADGTATTTLDLRAETAASGAVDDTPASTVSAVSDLPVLYPSLLSFTQPQGANGFGSGTLAVFDGTHGAVHITTDFERLPYGVPPTFSTHSLSLSGTLAAFAVRADSPRYINGSGAVNGYLATTSGARSLDDVFGARTLGTAYAYPDGAAVAARQVQLQTERGHPDWALVAAYYDTGGVNVYRTVNGGATWNAKASLPPAYDSNLPNNAATWETGLWLHPDGGGSALVSAADAVSNPPGAHLWLTNDYGATWTMSTAAGQWPIAGIVKPLGRTDVVFHGYIELIGSNVIAGIRRSLGAAHTDITPTVGGLRYGIGYGGGHAQRAIAVADDDPNALVVVGYHAQSQRWGVFQSFNGLSAAPIWTTLVAPGTGVLYRGAYYVNRATIYLYGDGGALAVCQYANGAWTINAVTISGCGTIVGICGG
ncbi:MAG: hypothetical protein IPO91_11085 [Chloroflexi bacterium]|nr:hypothetical protein [Chloroflexota bacterium]